MNASSVSSDEDTTTATMIMIATKIKIKNTINMVLHRDSGLLDGSSLDAISNAFVSVPLVPLLPYFILLAFEWHLSKRRQKSLMSIMMIAAYRINPRRLVTVTHGRIIEHVTERLE